MVAEGVAGKLSHALKNLIEDELCLLSVSLFDQTLDHARAQLIHRHASDLPTADLKNEVALLQRVDDARLNDVVPVLREDKLFRDGLDLGEKLLTVLLGKLTDRSLYHPTSVLVKRK